MITYQIKLQCASKEAILHQETATFRSEEAQNPRHHVSLTELIHPKDPLALQFGDDKRKKIGRLITWGTPEIVLRNELRHKDKFPSGRFFLAVEESGIDKTFWEDRDAVQGQKHKTNR